MSENLVGKTMLKQHEAAKPVHIQRLEAALDVRPFVSQVERILNSDGFTDSEDDSDAKSVSNEMSKGDRIVHGVVTTKQERRGDRLRLYNVSAVGEERLWLRDVLLLSDSSSEDEEPAERLRRLLRERARHNKHARSFYADAANSWPVLQNSRYMYYGAGLLSTVDRYPERRAARPAAGAARARRGRPPAGRSPAAGRVAARPRRPRAAPPERADWEAGAPDEAAAGRGRRKPAAAKSPEALRARRRRHWLLLVKKELGKLQRARAAAHRDLTLQRKRLAALCCKHWRHVAMQSQKNMKETVWRCKRLSREMQAYWRRYDRAEREARRRLEREAEEQRKMDVELMEAKRQRRKLNFLITQTELYAHFMQRKLGDEPDGGAERILRQLDDDDDADAKERAAHNARRALRAERARTGAFDAAAGAAPPAPAAPSAPRGDHAQPDIFRGTLKGYQLKGMNWLANLYDQGISGILADEMGLGKTVQCIAFLCHVAERLGVWGPFLVVSPASTLHNWQQECQRFVPDFKVVPYWGSPSERKILRQFWERKDLHTRQAAFHVVVTSYQIVVSDLKYLNRVSWQYMILDEAQAIKSSASMRWKLLLGFSCRNRLLLSGTPIQNSMAELWALLHFIMPTLFDSHEEFNEWFSKDIESHAENKTAIDEKHLSRLHMILKPFMLRRIKKDVENELSDKIEVMVHCPLTGRQKLLYSALKKKIKIEELLHYSVGAEAGHGVDKNFTSNLMNLVMQFRKVCNHPELFERRDVRSPLALAVDDYHLPRLVAERGLLLRALPSARRLLYNTLSVLPAAAAAHAAPAGLLGWLALADLAPAELAAVALGGWLPAMLHLQRCRRRDRRLRQRRAWWAAPEPARTRLLVCPAGDTLRRARDDGEPWSQLLFVEPVWPIGGPVYAHEAPDEGAALQPARLPAALLVAQPKVLCRTRAAWASSRAHAYLAERHARAECAAGAALLARLVAAARPPLGWPALQVPDKNQLVSDAGKLTVLDSLLKRLKERGHRVLIYSQMTKMIDLLEEYMWHRKHKYMRLDGSSKISARRDMVADFQARADIFVFLLSTRAGGLGINLTAADTVIFYDSDWNPTVDQQAMDRAHRLGQTKQVTVYRLICQGTIEERIMQRAQEKSEIQRMVISGGNFKPDTLKPKEVVSLLLDDDDIDLKYRQKSEEKKIIEEKERKRKLGILPAPAAPGSETADTSAGAADEGGADKRLRAPSPRPAPAPWPARGARAARRGRPRGSRHHAARRPPPAPPTPAPPESESVPSSEPQEAGGGEAGAARGRRGPGRPRLRSAARAPSRRPRRPREPLLVPLAPPP